jgi:hypothetical protein
VRSKHDRLICIDEGAPKKTKRTGLIVSGVIALIVLLAGAAFVGGRLLNQQSGDPNSTAFSGGAGGAQRVSVSLERAKELPNAEPAVSGLFAERKDNSIFVTLGDQFMVTVDKDGSVNTKTDGNGQTLEVVVTGDTILYKDVTQLNNVKAQPSSGAIQQQIEPGSLDGIGSNSMISAWGERHGDRVIAEVLLYSQMHMIKAPAAQP